jgi:tRNA1(Val) A37 N6-methylase TrmN6
VLLYQPQDGYCYNSDTIILSSFIERFLPKGSVLDVGAGCGVLGFLVWKNFTNIDLEGVEKQEVFVKYAKINARVNHIKYHIYHQDFLYMQEEKKYDFIISNPPFYHDGVQKSSNEMLFNARYNVNLPMGIFFKKVSRLLKPNSHFVFCYDAAQFGLICAELEKVKLRVVDVQFVYPRINKNASLVMLHVRNNSKSLMKVWEPFVNFEGDEFSQMTKDIYKKASTHSIKCAL